MSLTPLFSNKQNVSSNSTNRNHAIKHQTNPPNKKTTKKTEEQEILET